MYVSSTPTSNDWMVVVTRVNEGPDIIVVDTLTCGKQEWSTSKFVQKEAYLFELSSCNAVGCKGLLYFLGKHGWLMVHDLKRNKFFIYGPPAPIWQQLINVREQYLLESDGKIIAVFVGSDGSWIRVCRWNSSMRKWEILENLGNKALFISHPLSICETVKARSGMGNKIYFTRLVDDHCVFYSLATKKFHTFNGYSSETFHGAMKLYKPSTCINPRFHLLS